MKTCFALAGARLARRWRVCGRHLGPVIFSVTPVGGRLQPQVARAREGCSTPKRGGQRVGPIVEARTQRSISALKKRQSEPSLKAGMLPSLSMQ